jgi:hypothetical protein
MTIVLRRVTSLVLSRRYGSVLPPGWSFDYEHRNASYALAASWRTRTRRLDALIWNLGVKLCLLQTKSGTSVAAILKTVVPTGITLKPAEDMNLASK